MKIYHWWPGRTWAGPCPIPEDIIENAIKTRRRYLTVARANLPHDGYLLAVSECSRKDVPNRKLGRHIAVERLRKKWEIWFPGVEL